VVKTANSAVSFYKIISVNFEDLKIHTGCIPILIKEAYTFKMDACSF